MNDGDDESDRKYIRFGLSAVRGVGEAAAEHIVAMRRKSARRWADLQEFCNAIDHAVVNKKAIEALIKAGAMDSLHPDGNRAAMMAALDGCIAKAKRISADLKSGQRDMFGSRLAQQTLAPELRAEPVPDVPDDEVEIDIIAWGRLAGLRIGDEGDAR